MPGGPAADEVNVEALRLWRLREMMLPRFVRRMTPDALDHQSGAWARMVVEARESLITVGSRHAQAPSPNAVGQASEAIAFTSRSQVEKL